MLDWLRDLLPGQVSGEDPVALNPPASVLEDDCGSTSTPTTARTHIINAGTFAPDEQGATDELYDDDWSAWDTPSRGAENWRRARRNWQAHRAVDSLLEDVRAAQAPELYEVDWNSLPSPLPSPQQAVGKWTKARGLFQASQAMDGVLTAVRGRQLAQMYDRDWATEAAHGDCVRTEDTSAGSTPVKVAQDTSEVGSSRRQEPWHKLSLAEDGVKAMEMYEQDWTQAALQLDHEAEAEAAEDLPTALATSAAV